MLFVTDAGVRNLLDDGFRNLAADRVRLLTVTDFLLHPCAGNRAGFNPRNPAAAADSATGLFTNRLAAAWLIDATVEASIPRPGPGIAGVPFHHGARNLLRLGHPVAGADLDFLGFANWLADGVADVAVAGLGFGAISRAADVAVFRFVNWFGDGAANVAVAGLINRLTNGAADVAVAGLIDRLANRAADIAVAGLVDRLANRAANVTVAGLVDRLANGIALITIAGLVNGPCAGHRKLFRTLIVHGSAAGDRLLIVDGFTHCLITGPAAALGCHVITTGGTCCWSTILVARRPAVGGFNVDVGSKRQQARYDDPSYVSHQSVP